MPDEKSMNPVGTYMQLFGPYGFGLVSLLLIWFSIVRPELESNKISFESQGKIIMSLTEHNLNQRELVKAMDKTTQTLNITAQILERTVGKLDGHTTQ